MTFLEQIFDRLQRTATAPVVQEIHDGSFVSVTGSELLAMTQQARQFLTARGMQKGERCVLLAPNSIRWIALDLALMAEGVIVVPLYARQAVAELISMMKDSTPSRIFCHDAALAAEIKKLWPQAPHISLLESVFVDDAKSVASAPPGHAEGRRAGNNHLYLRNFRRTERRGADRCQHYFHARLHQRPPGPADGRAHRAGAGFSVHTILLRGVVDRPFNGAFA